eukprot:1741615-Amphidinium_carterae.1
MSQWGATHASKEGALCCLSVWAIPDSMIGNFMPASEKVYNMLLFARHKAGANKERCLVTTSSQL